LASAPGVAGGIEAGMVVQGVVYLYEPTGPVGALEQALYFRKK
jgi:hypothetical protein